MEQPIRLEDKVGMEGILEEPHWGLVYILKQLKVWSVDHKH